MNSRRHFFRQLAVTASAPVLLCSKLFAQDTPALVPLPETDPLAMALGYKEDTSKVDATKYPQHKAEQKCLNCALYQGKPGEKTGACPIFAGKTVTAEGWCVSYAPKPPAPAPTPRPGGEAPAEEAPSQPEKTEKAAE